MVRGLAHKIGQLPSGLVFAERDKMSRSSSSSESSDSKTKTVSDEERAVTSDDERVVGGEVEVESKEESIESVEDSFVDPTAPYWKTQHGENCAALQRRFRKSNGDLGKPPAVIRFPATGKESDGSGGSRAGGGKRKSGSRGGDRHSSTGDGEPRGSKDRESARSGGRRSSGAKSRKSEGSRKPSGGEGGKRPAESGPEGEGSAKKRESRSGGSKKDVKHGKGKPGVKQPPSYLDAYAAQFGAGPKPAGKKDCELCVWYEDTFERVLNGVLARSIRVEGDLKDAREELEGLRKELEVAKERARVAEAKPVLTGPGTRSGHHAEARAIAAEDELARVQKEYGRLSSFGLKTPKAGESHVSAVVRAWTGGKWAGWYTVNRLRPTPGADGKYKDDLWYVEPTLTWMYRGAPAANEVRRGLVARRWVSTPANLERLHPKVLDAGKRHRNNLKEFHEDAGYLFGNEVVGTKKKKRRTG